MFADALIAPRTAGPSYFAIVPVTYPTRAVRSAFASAHKRAREQECRGLAPTKVKMQTQSMRIR